MAEQKPMLTPAGVEAMMDEIERLPTFAEQADAIKKIAKDIGDGDWAIFRDSGRFRQWALSDNAKAWIAEQCEALLQKNKRWWQ